MKLRNFSLTFLLSCLPAFSCGEAGDAEPTRIPDIDAEPRSGQFTVVVDGEKTEMSGNLNTVRQTHMAAL